MRILFINVKYLSSNHKDSGEEFDSYFKPENSDVYHVLRGRKIDIEKERNKLNELDWEDIEEVWYFDGILTIYCPICKKELMFKAWIKFSISHLARFDKYNTARLILSSIAIKRHLKKEHKIELKVVKKNIGFTKRLPFEFYPPAVRVHLYQCPFCSFQGTLKEVVDHIAKNHVSKVSKNGNN